MNNNIDNKNDRKTTATDAIHNATNAHNNTNDNINNMNKTTGSIITPTQQYYWFCFN